MNRLGTAKERITKIEDMTIETFKNKRKKTAKSRTEYMRTVG
jgi:hypothetical protein